MAAPLGTVIVLAPSYGCHKVLAVPPPIQTPPPLLTMDAPVSVIPPARLWSESDHKTVLSLPLPEDCIALPLPSVMLPLAFRVKVALLLVLLLSVAAAGRTTLRAESTLRLPDRVLVPRKLALDDSYQLTLRALAMVRLSRLTAVPAEPR